jgi:hypothetical protein
VVGCFAKRKETNAMQDAQGYAAIDKIEIQRNML